MNGAQSRWKTCWARAGQVRYVPVPKAVNNACARHVQAVDCAVPAPQDPDSTKKNRATDRPVLDYARERFAYFNEVLIASKLVFNAEPTPFTAVIMAMAMPAAISPYSMAVAPDSSRKNFLTRVFIVDPALIL
jgi:hypothetical protein